MASLFNKEDPLGHAQETATGLEINCSESSGTTEGLSNPTEKGKRRMLLELK